MKINIKTMHQPYDDDFPMEEINLVDLYKEEVEFLKKQNEFLEKISNWGFKTNSLNKLISGVKNLILNYQTVLCMLDQLIFSAPFEQTCLINQLVERRFLNLLLVLKRLLKLNLFVDMLY